MLRGREPILVTPEDGSGVTYTLRAPTVVDLPRYRAEITKLGGRQATIGQQLTALEAAADALLAGDTAGREAVGVLVQRQRELLDDYLAEIKAIGEGWSWGDEAAQRLLEVIRWPEPLEAFARMAMSHGPYAELVADNTTYHLVRGIAAARIALSAVEGAELPVTRRAGLVVDEVLDRIPERHLIAIGDAYEAACTLSRDQKKALPSPSGGESVPPASSAASTARLGDPGSTMPGPSTSSAGGG